MKRSRVLLLSLMVALLSLASRGHATAASCVPCECAQNCWNAQESCFAFCKGNQACDTACSNNYAACIRSCPE